MNSIDWLEEEIKSLKRAYEGIKIQRDAAEIENIQLHESLESAESEIARLTKELEAAQKYIDLVSRAGYV